jgi:hypothetical protein
MEQKPSCEGRAWWLRLAFLAFVLLAATRAHRAAGWPSPLAVQIVLLLAPIVALVASAAFVKQGLLRVCADAIFEVLSPLCLLHRRLRYAWIAVMFAFHALAYVFMHLLFWWNMALIPILLIDWKPSGGGNPFDNWSPQHPAICADFPRSR